MNRNARASWAAWLLCVACPLSGCQRARVDTTLQSRSERRVLLPSAIASLASDHETLGLPAELRLGVPFGRRALYLKFPNQARAPGRIAAAFLTLTPTESALSNGAPIAVEVWRIKSDWDAPQMRAWSDQPELGPPYARAEIPNAPVRELRIDVSELVRFAASAPDQDFGLALLARSGPGPGVAFASGMAGGSAPRLDIYLR